MGLFDWLSGNNTQEPNEKLIQAEEDAKLAARAEEKKRAAERDPKKEEKKQHKWQNPNEMIKFVCMGGKAICPFSPTPGDVIVTSTQVKLQDKFWATDADRNGASNPNILFKGVCTHPKWGSKQPPCATVIQLGKWENVSETRIDDFHALLRKSTIKCLISNQDIQIIDSGQKAFIEAAEPQTTPPKPAPPGYYYTEKGAFLGKILHHEDVYITDPATFESMKKKQPWSEANVIAFTEKYNLTNTELLDRANWIYAEGGYKIPEYYAYTIENAYNHPNIGNKNEERLYHYQMQSKEPVEVTKTDGTKESKTIHLDKNLYFSGGYTNQTGKAFWSKREDPSQFDADMIDCVRSVIKSKLHPESDPTGGTDSWLGYSSGSHVGIYYIVSRGSRHFFNKSPNKNRTSEEKKYEPKE